MAVEPSCHRASLLLQIAALETQSTRDVTTITRLNAEIKKISDTVGNSNGEISRLQRSVRHARIFSLKFGQSFG